jgi:hypothetical protein
MHRILNKPLLLPMKISNKLTLLIKLVLDSIYMERVPTASMLIRVYRAPKKPDGTVMSLDNVRPEHWQDENVLI